MTSAAFDVQLAGTVAELAAIEAEWWQLWRAAAATPFQSPAWLLPWWRAFSPGRLATVTVRQDGRLVGLAPLYLEAESDHRRLLPLGISVSDYLDVLLHPGASAAAGRQLVAAVSRLESWRDWEWPDLAPDAAVLALDPPPRWQSTVERSSPCMVIDLSPGKDGADAIPRSRQRKLRMARHRAERRGRLGFLEADATNVDHLAARLIELHGACWAARGEPGVLADPRFQDFLRDSAPRLLEAGMLRLHAVSIDDRIVAVLMGLHHAGRSYAFLSGFDPEFAHESPGSVALGRFLQQAVRDGAREIDLLRGDEAYKAQWGARPRFNMRRIFRRASARADAA